MRSKLRNTSNYSFTYISSRRGFISPDVGPFYEPPGSLLVSMRHLKNLALFKIGADDLQSDRQSQGRKPTTEADSRQPRHIKRHRESGTQAYACRLKRNSSAVNLDESPFALFDGRRGYGRGRCHYHIQLVKSLFKLIADNSSGSLSGDVARGRDHQRTDQPVEQRAAEVMGA